MATHHEDEPTEFDEKDDLRTDPAPLEQNPVASRRIIVKSKPWATRDTLVVIAALLVGALLHRTAEELSAQPSEASSASNWSPRRLAEQRAQFRTYISAQSVGDTVRFYSQLPHLAGSERNRELARETYRRFVSYGFDEVRVQTLPALLMNLSKRRVVRLDLVSHEPVESLNLDEENIVGQPGWDVALPPTNGYTGSGKVTGPVVWANYGRQEDFEELRDVNLTNSIVVVRYGMIYRGDKVKYAQQRGAAGVIICLDPWDTALGAPFPEGPWATNTTVQRGSLANTEGDPLTPTWPSEFGGPTISPSETHDETVMGEGMALPSIPVQPVSYGNARKILAGLSGSPLPGAWRNTGFLSLLERGIGPGPALVEVEVVRTLVSYNLTNVVGLIRGSEEADRTVIIGAHRDSWTYGAVDDVAGHSILLEAARALGKLRFTGWRPRRSIQLCSWDGEEWAIIGSNEFVETNIELLRQRAVAYLNLDSGVSGTEVLSVSGSPLLEFAATFVAKEVPLPRRPNQFLDAIMDSFAACGSGSDHVGFIQLAGVPVLDANVVNRTDSYQAVYHSNFDSFLWTSKFGDPGFAFHAAMAQYYGSLALLLSDSVVLPLHVEDYATKLAQWVDEYKTKPENAFANFAFMDRSVALYAEASQRHAARRSGWEQTCAEAPHTITTMEWLKVRELNDISGGVERVFLGRGKEESSQPWYRHVIFTPSAQNSYAASTMPLIGAALRSRNATLANFAIGRVAQYIRRAATFLNSSDVCPPWYTNHL